MIMALAFVPPANEIATFGNLCNEIRQHFQSDLDEVLEYFEENYIGGQRRYRQRAAQLFNLNLWNMYQRAANE